MSMLIVFSVLNSSHASTIRGFNHPLSLPTAYPPRRLSSSRVSGSPGCVSFPRFATAAVRRVRAKSSSPSRAWATPQRCSASASPQAYWHSAYTEASSPGAPGDTLDRRLRVAGVEIGAGQGQTQLDCVVPEAVPARRDRPGGCRPRPRPGPSRRPAPPARSRPPSDNSGAGL